MTTRKPQKALRRSNGEGSIFFDQTKGRWCAQLQVGYSRKTGRPLTHRKFTSSQREAREALQKMREKYALITCPDAGTITVGEWVTEWYETYSRPHLRENTQREYAYMVRIAKEELGRIRLDQLTNLDLQRVIFGRLGKTFGNAIHFRKVMKLACKRAVKNGLLARSPADDLELPPRPPKRKFAKPTSEAWRALLDAEVRNYSWRMVILTEYVTGCRMSELLALWWEDISLEHDAQGRITGGHVHIGHALIVAPDPERPGHMRTLRRGTKSLSGDRVLALPAAYCKELMAYRHAQKKRELATADWEKSDYIFTTNQGQCLSPNVFGGCYRRVAQRLGLKTTFHMLRHDMASRMKASRHFDLKDIQTQLGHSTINVTMDIYTHIDDEENREVSCWLESGLGDLLNREKQAQAPKADAQ